MNTKNITVFIDRELDPSPVTQEIELMAKAIIERSHGIGNFYGKELRDELQSIIDNFGVDVDKQ